MRIKQDPITGLYCREDGAVLMPPTGGHFKTFRWTCGFDSGRDYKQVRLQGKIYYVHAIVCRAFHGLAPEDKPEVDHINRIRHDNRCSNLHWVNRKENNDNVDKVDRSIEKYNCRHCEDEAAYNRAWRESHREEHRAFARVYYETHREQILAHAKARYKRRKHA